MRILTKGGSVPGVSYDEADWSKSVNIKDYDVAILNLNDILESAGELLAPSSDVPQAIEFPSAEDIVKILKAGNQVFVFLPGTRNINLLRVKNGESNKQEVDLLSWLPIGIETVAEPGESVAKSSVAERWKWYFDEDFDWPMYLSRVSLKDDMLPGQSVLDRANKHTIAQTTFEEDIASRIQIFSGGDYASVFGPDDLERRYPGSIYLLPLKPDYTFEKATSELLSELYGLSHNINPTPEWARNKRLPQQEDIIEQLQKLRSEYERLDRYSELFYEDGDELEKIVLSAFQELGFETKPEVPGKRDGAVVVRDRIFVLETHGTENAIGVSKVDQLDRWVRNAAKEFQENTIVGLLVANAHRGRKPENRGKPIVGDPEDHLKEYGYKILKTETLYRLLEEHQIGSLSKKDIEEVLISSDTFVRYN